MTPKLRLVSIPLALILIVSLSWQRIVAQPSLEEYYDEETGHWIRGDFLALYHNVSDPIKIFGRPITEAYIPDSDSPTIIQYFQKARFTSMIDESGNKKLSIDPLGFYLYQPGNPEARIDNESACRYFSNSIYPVCYAFLDFYEANGGEDQFGEPLSNVELHNGRPSQYFRNARLEWHPALPAGERVVVSDLGYDYFFRMQEDISLLGPVKNAAIDGFLRLEVSAYPHFAVTGGSGQQTIYVSVHDQRNLPVPGAHVDLVVNWPTGNPSHYAINQLTNDHGVTQYSFDFDPKTQGIVIVEVIVTYRSLQRDTVTSFRIWW